MAGVIGVGVNETTTGQDGAGPEQSTAVSEQTPVPGQAYNVEVSICNAALHLKYCVVLKHATFDANPH